MIDKNDKVLFVRITAKQKAWLKRKAKKDGFGRLSAWFTLWLNDQMTKDKVK